MGKVTHRCVGRHVTCKFRLGNTSVISSCARAIRRDELPSGMTELWWKASDSSGSIRYMHAYADIYRPAHIHRNAALATREHMLRSTLFGSTRDCVEDGLIHLHVIGQTGQTCWHVSRDHSVAGLFSAARASMCHVDIAVACAYR